MGVLMYPIYINFTMRLMKEFLNQFLSISSKLSIVMNFSTLHPTHMNQTYNLALKDFEHSSLLYYIGCSRSSSALHSNSLPLLPLSFLNLLYSLHSCVLLVLLLWRESYKSEPLARLLLDLRLRTIWNSCLWGRLC